MATHGTTKRFRSNIFIFSVFFLIQLLVQSCHTAPVDDPTTPHAAQDGSTAVPVQTTPNKDSVNITVPSNTPPKNATTTSPVSNNPEPVSGATNTNPNALTSPQNPPKAQESLTTATKSIDSKTTLDSGTPQDGGDATTDSGKTALDSQKSEPAVPQTEKNASAVDASSTDKVPPMAADVTNNADANKTVVTQSKDSSPIDTPVDDKLSQKDTTSEANNANLNATEEPTTANQPEAAVTDGSKSAASPNDMTTKGKPEGVLLDETAVIGTSEDEEEPDVVKPQPSEPTEVTDTTEFDLTAVPEANTLLPGFTNKQDLEQIATAYTGEDEDDEEEDYTDYGPILPVEQGRKDEGSVPGQKQPPNVVVARLEPIDAEEENSHFFFHLVILAFLVAIVYITYHNKRKIFLLAQSRRWRDSLCSRNTVEYHRLDTNVNEAMPSLKITRDYIF